MNEQRMIEMFSRIHKTSPYNADAEILPLKDTNLLVSTDSFSEREDFLFGLKPEAMGRVMAYGAITDILACGAKPEYLVQSWNIDRLHDERFYERVAIGIQEVVSNYGAKVVGGDMGVVGVGVGPRPFSVSLFRPFAASLQSALILIFILRGLAGLPMSRRFRIVLFPRLCFANLFRTTRFSLQM